MLTENKKAKPDLDELWFNACDGTFFMMAEYIENGNTEEYRRLFASTLEDWKIYKKELELQSGSSEEQASLEQSI